MKTVVGLYNSVTEAKKVKSILTSEGYDSSDITVIDQTDDRSGTGGTSTAYNTSGSTDNSIGSKIKNFFGSLGGHDDDSHRSYTEGVSNGGALLAVTVDDADADETADLLYSNGARDIQGGYQSLGYGAGAYGDTTLAGTQAGAQDVAVLEGNTGRTGSNTTGQQVIPVVAEELEVGKREVQRGGVRIYSRVVTEPVSESVTLHDERVVVDRRAVDRPATEADFKTDSNIIEVTATGEEAVVGKRSRVVEEVMVGKEASDRTEEISDTVRHTEVEVEPAGTSSFGTASGRNTDYKR